MRYLVISDIHGNVEALRAVKRKAPPHDRLVCLGDLVGYGAAPNEVIHMVQEMKPVVIVRGNHDKVCSGLDSGDNFNENAYQSALWTQKRLSPKNLNYLRRLPAGPAGLDSLISVCHGSPMDEDAYILYEHDAYMSFQCFDTPFCFFGHTHVPGVFVMEVEPPAFYYFIPKGPATFAIDMSHSKRYLINPGSIGQPRDGDPSASYCLFDTEEALLIFYREGYPVARSADRIIRAGLPPFLAERLRSGI